MTAEQSVGARVARGTLLVVDDEPIICELIQAVIEDAELPVVVLTARNGQEALAVLRHTRPDLILMDLTMPVLDGWETARRLKADPTTAAIPLLALSALAMPGDRERALAAGCDGYIAKPVDLSVLVEVVRNRLT